MNLNEFSYSKTAIDKGIDNTIPENLIQNANDFIEKIYTPLSELFPGKAIHLNSGFRSKALNDALPRASKTSQHMLASAMDFTIEGLSLQEIIKKIRNSDIAFDQVILERTWVHIGRNPTLSDEKQRKQFKNFQ